MFDAFSAYNNAWIGKLFLFSHNFYATFANTSGYRGHRRAFIRIEKNYRKYRYIIDVKY
jgi:hypothetical protein